MLFKEFNIKFTNRTYIKKNMRNILFCTKKSLIKSKEWAFHINKKYRNISRTTNINIRNHLLLHSE